MYTTYLFTRDHLHIKNASNQKLKMNIKHFKHLPEKKENKKEKKENLEIRNYSQF